MSEHAETCLEEFLYAADGDPDNLWPTWCSLAEGHDGPHANYQAPDMTEYRKSAKGDR